MKLVPLTFALFLIPVVGLAQETPSSNDSGRSRRAPVPRVRYELGPDSRIQEGVPRGKLEGPFLFRSQIIADTVRKYWVSVPAQYDGSEPACLLVFQDGARAINPDGVLQVPRVLDNLIAKKQIPLTIGIYITPGQRGSEFPDTIGTGNPNNRDLEYDVLNDSYARMVVEEIIPAVGRKYRLVDDPAGRAIGGASSGGICAFTVAWERPSEFRNVISLIGSFTDIHGGHVYPQLIRESEAKPIRVFLQDGESDNRNAANPTRDWHLQNQKMVAALQEKDYDMAHVFGEGGHSDDHGGAILPQMLRWIWRDYPGVDAPGDDLVAAAAAVAPVKVELFPGFDAQASIDPSGDWTWQRRFRRRSTISKLHLTLEGQQLTGTFVTESGQAAPEKVAIQTPEVEGNKISFGVTREFNGRSFDVTYQGIVLDDKIVGWQMFDFNGTSRDSSWTATRVADAGPTD